MCDCHGNGQDCVGAQLALVGCAVECDHGTVDSDLVEGIHAFDCRSDYVVHVVNSLENALSEVALLVAVAKLNSLVDTGGSSGRTSCTAEGTVFENDIDFNGRVAT